jgi:D-arabinose 1-dehydrogenase-like Zn-dependent alcohol dehydrogenase
MLTSAPAAVAYALSLIRPHGLIIYTSGPPVVHMPVLDFIWKDITAIGTQNGTARDMLEMAQVCVERGIKSAVRAYEFDEGAMNRMLEDVQGEGWSGKAVVKVRGDLWG